MMSVFATPAVVTALLSGAASVAALRGAWRRKGIRNGVLVLIGWLALALSLALWSSALGIEYGVSYALAWFALCAIIAVILNREHRAPQPDRAAPLSEATTMGHKWLTFFAAGPLAVIACVPLTLLVTLLLPVARVNQMALAAVLFPTLWGLAAYWASARDNPGRLGIGFTLLALASYASLRLVDVSP